MSGIVEQPTWGERYGTLGVFGFIAVARAIVVIVVGV
jgi:hypothetical protein